MTILERILERKREEVASLRQARSEAAWQELALAGPPVRGFTRALDNAGTPRVIAEFKRASPSRGQIRPGAEPAAIAREYAEAGAGALSVLTDRDFFQGSLADLQAARAACALPVLRKDFMIDPLQILEARSAGADAVLLIVAALADDTLRELAAAGSELGMGVLVEVHTEDELDRARAAGADLIGINNRDLRSFVTDVDVTRRLLDRTEGSRVVSESGIDDPAVVRDLASRGVHAFLVGEALMREPSPGKALQRLRGS